MIVIFFLVLILIIIFLYLKTEHETFISMPADTIDSVSKHECYLLVDSVLNNINNKFKQNFVRGELDRVEKTYDEQNDSINYKINGTPTEGKVQVEIGDVLVVTIVKSGSGTASVTLEEFIYS